MANCGRVRAVQTEWLESLRDDVASTDDGQLKTLVTNMVESLYATMHSKLEAASGGEDCDLEAASAEIHEHVSRPMTCVIIVRAKQRVKKTFEACSRFCGCTHAWLHGSTHKF